MLNFEEEIKKFKPSLEVEQIEDAVYQEDLTDMTDILREMMQKQGGIYKETYLSIELLV